MKVKDCYNLHDIIRELEVVFQIDGRDFEEKDVDVLLANVKTRISRQYQIDAVSYRIDSDELTMGESRKAVILFVDNVARIHAKLCGYGQILRYNQLNEISLSSINFLGFEESSLKTTLVAMQREYYLPKISENIAAIKTKLGAINNCWEKRLFILAIVACELGFSEVTACIGEILFMGMLK